MLALRVPCDAQLSRRDVKLAGAQTTHPFSPAQFPLLGKPERDLKVNIHRNIKKQQYQYCKRAVSARFCFIRARQPKRG